MQDGSPSTPSDPAPGDAGANATGDDQHADHRRRAGRESVTPRRIPGESVLGPQPDRQVVVVGETIVGLALTLLLRRAGYDPLLVAGANHDPRTRVTYLWPPAVSALDAVDVGPSLRDASEAIEGVSVGQAERGHGSAPPYSTKGMGVRPEGADGAEGAGETPPRVVRTHDLARILRDRLPDEQRRLDREVETLSKLRGGIEVEFDDGVRECFDGVVHASNDHTGLQAQGRTPDDYTTVTQYETDVTVAASAENGIREFWHTDALLQRLPRPDAPGSVLRVTTTRTELPASVADDYRMALFPGEPDATATATGLDGVESDRIRQVLLRDVEPERAWWGSDRVAICGAAACPVAPASGIPISLGIENAVAFVSALAGEYRPVPAVVDAYAADQVHRLTNLCRRAEDARADHEYPIPSSPGSPLHTLGVLRSVALGPFLGGEVGSLQRDGFD